MDDPRAAAPRWLGPVIGLVTAGVTLGVAHLVAGWVDAVGPAVTRFRPGDEVYGDNLMLIGALIAAT